MEHLILYIKNLYYFLKKGFIGAFTGPLMTGFTGALMTGFTGALMTGLTGALIAGFTGVLMTVFFAGAKNPSGFPEEYK